MTAGRLAAAKPAATTNTTLYRCPIDKAASVVLNVCNQGSSAATYRAALRDYDQILTLDDSDYSFRKGNVISSYSVNILPSISALEINPGEEIVVNNGKSKFKYHDIFKSTDIIEYGVKVANIGSVNFLSPTLSGQFSVGDVITGSVTGLSAKVYSVADESFRLSIDPVTNIDTTSIFNNVTGIEVDDFISTNTEILQVTDITDYEITFTRANFVTTASSINPGTLCIIVRDTTDTTTINEGASLSDTDTTLTLTSVEDISIGSYLSIGNEFLLVQTISGNDVTVDRGVLGTTATTHIDGSTVKIYNFVGNTYIKFFQFDEEVDNGEGASVQLNVLPGVSAFSSANRFVYDLGTGEYEYLSIIPVDIETVIKFDLSDSSNTTHPFKFSLTLDGIHQGGTEYTTGVTTNGTPGQPDAYTQIDLSRENVGLNQIIYTYCENHPNMTEGGYLQINTNPSFGKIYIYDVDSEIEINDSFTFNNVNYTIIEVTSGPYGYVQSYDSDSSSLKVSLGSGSILFDEDDEFFDSPKINAENRNLVVVEGAEDIDSADYFAYQKQLSANATDKNTGIVVGPGQSLLVYSSTADISYSVTGFEDTTTDYSLIYYDRDPLL
jgi:hypothetical protein